MIHISLNTLNASIVIFIGTTAYLECNKMMALLKETLNYHIMKRIWNNGKARAC